MLIHLNGVQPCTLEALHWPTDASERLLLILHMH